MLRGILAIQPKRYTAINFSIGARNMASLIQNKAFIDGCWVDASNNETFEVTNPANGQVIGTVPNMNDKDAQYAINAARRAFKSKEWSALTSKQRSILLKKWYSLMETHHTELAEIMTAESGKPLNEAKGEALYASAFIEWFAEEARRIYGELIQHPLPNREIIVMKRPIGVAALITPWNFPMAMITRKAGAALAAGCTLVIKPAEDTPLTALALTKLAEEAGFPKGVINIVTTKKSAPIGELLCNSPDIAAISFTGSTEVGKLLYRNCANSIKRLCLELGGNAPFIIFNSANVEKAVDGAMASKFRNCGQTCVSANRFFVQDGVYDKFVELLKQRVAALKIGHGCSTDVQIGPLINRMQFEKVSAIVEDARSHDAKILAGGKSCPQVGELFYEPTIVTDISPNTRLYNEEVFGPVISIIKFTTEEEAIEKANNTRRGLAGYFYTTDMQQVFRVANQLEVGMMGVNEGLISTVEAPFGGVKESGLGREGSHHGIDDYVDIKYVCLGDLKNY